MIGLGRCSAHFKMIGPFAALCSAHAVFTICMLKHFQCVCKCFTHFVLKFNTNTMFSRSFIFTVLKIQQEVSIQVYFSFYSPISTIECNTLSSKSWTFVYPKVVISQCHLELRNKPQIYIEKQEDNTSMTKHQRTGYIFDFKNTKIMPRIGDTERELK